MKEIYYLRALSYNCHEADLAFGRGLPHKINNFDETWVENAKAKNINQLQVISYNGHGPPWYCTLASPQQSMNVTVWLAAFI